MIPGTLSRVVTDFVDAFEARKKAEARYEIAKSAWTSLGPSWSDPDDGFDELRAYNDAEEALNEAKKVWDMRWQELFAAAKILRNQ